MFTVTPDATQAINQLLAADDVPAGAGLRIESAGAVSTAAKAEGDSGLRIVVASQAAGGDQVLENQGARVFIEPSVSHFLDDKQLGVTPDEHGMAFMLVQM